jgi:hypothetical protein
VQQLSQFNELRAQESAAPDEPTMIEVWSMIVARWRWVAGIAVLAVAVSAVAAVLFHPDYLYSSSFELASTNDGGDSVQTAGAKLQETYIPQAREIFARAHPGARIPSLAVRIPPESRFVVLESRGKAEDAAQHQEIHRAVLDTVGRDLEAKTLSRRRALQAALDEATQRLHETADHVKLLQARQRQIEDKRRLQQARRAELQAAVSAAERDRAAAQNDAARTPALLLIDQRILVAKDQMASIDESLAVGLTDERNTLEKEERDVLRSQTGYRQTIERTEQDLAALSSAPAFTLARRSEVPVGPIPAVLFALGVAAGVLTGVLLAIVAGLVDRGRVRHAAGT